MGQRNTEVIEDMNRIIKAEDFPGLLIELASNTIEMSL